MRCRAARGTVYPRWRPRPRPRAAPGRLSTSLRGARLREAGWGYGFALVPLAVFGLFFIYPFGYAVYISFFHWGILGKTSPGTGTFNYAKVLHDPVFHTALKNIAEYTRRGRPARDGARALARARHQPEDPRPQLLPLRLLLPVDRLVGRDHDDHPLHLQPERPVQPHLRLQHGLVRAMRAPSAGGSSA